jgi:hypothetical protein
MLAPSRLRGACAAILAALGVGGACGGKTIQAGGLEVIVTTNLSTPADFNSLHVTVRQEIDDGGFGTPLVDSDFPIPSATTLPTRFSIQAGSTPDQVALIDVIGRKDGSDVVSREVQIQIPTDRVAELVVLLAADCIGKTCPAGQTCDPTTASCTTTFVDVNQLPPYQPGDQGDATVPAPDGAMDGATMDVSMDGGGRDSGGSPDADAAANDAGPGDSGDGGCKPSVCAQVGTVCQGTQTVATCAKDANGCYYVASTAPCTMPDTCSGMPPNAMCSATCSDSCVQNQTTCLPGGLATCVRGSNGCLAYGTPTACGTHQSCTGAPGSAACTCNAYPPCTTVGKTCADGSTLATCMQDAQNCVFEMGTTPCTNGACSAGACCTNACTSGTTNCSTPTTLQTCTAGSNGCTAWTSTSCAAGVTCSEGSCGPITLATGQMSPAGIVTSNGFVYWINQGDGSVMKCAVNGCNLSPTKIVPGGGTNTGHDLRVDANNVYWANPQGGAIQRCPLTGCGAGGPATIASAVGPYFLDIDSTNVYWTDSATVSKCALTATGCTPTVLASGLSSNFNLVVSSNLVVWIEGNAVDYCPVSGCSGGVAQVLSAAIAGDAYGGLATDGLYVYWDNDKTSGPAVYSCFLVGGCGGSPPTKVVTTGDSLPQGMATDGTHVYWANYVASGTVMRAPVGGGSPTTLASGVNKPGFVAVDGTSVYWTNAGDGTVMKTGK